MPRIVHLASGREWRGGQRQVLILAAALARSEQVDSVVVTGQGTELATRLTAAGVPIFVVPWSLGLDPRVALYALSALQPGAILHAHDSHAHALADAISRMRDTPIVVTRRVTLPIKNPQRYRRADAVIAISSAVRDVLLRANVQPARIHVIPDAVDIAHVKGVHAWPAELPAVPDGTPLLVCVAALTREKGVDVLLEAAALLRATHPGARWIVLGEGPERAALEARRATLGLEAVVTLAGFVNEPESVLRTATIAVQPSLSEGLGSSVLDALALGIPVVASRAGGLPDALAHGGGVLVAPNAPAQLAGEVARLLDDGVERARLGHQGPMAAGHFGIDQLVQRTLDVYRSVAERQGAR
ncbi:MAG: glycosyltransferase [Gemmatimonadota bacterium]